MKLLSFNIQYGFGADGVYDLTRAAEVIAGADIACLQQVRGVVKAGVPVALD